MGVGGERVMVVEDDSSTREVLEHFLSCEGYVTKSFDSVDAALEALRRERFHVVVTDLRMRPRDGFQVIEAALALDAPPAIVVVSAYLDDDATRRLCEMGITAIMTKPVDRDRFVRAVAVALGSDRRE